MAKGASIKTVFSSDRKRGEQFLGGQRSHVRCGEMADVSRHNAISSSSNGTEILDGVFKVLELSIDGLI